MSGEDSRRRRLAATRFLAVVLTLAVPLLAARFLPLGEWLRSFQEWVAGFGTAGLFLYAALYVVVTVLLGPAWLMTLGAGFSFGLVKGVVVVWTGATAGAVVAFLIARHLARARVEKYARGNRRFRAMDRAIAEKGWRIVALLRLSPFIPFTISNYLYGLTGIRLLPYTLASAGGMFPLVVLYTYFGVAAREAAEAASGEAAARSPLEWLVLALGLLVTIAAAVVIARVARKALSEADLEEAEDRNKNLNASAP